jgi:5-methylcytosine-specific restriction protein A
MTRKPLSTRERQRLFELHGGVCHICHGAIAVGEPWDIEHRVPLAMGGLDNDQNRPPAHRACHKPKTGDDLANLARAKRRQAKHIGAKAPSRAVIPGSKRSPWKKRLDGTVERRET